MPPLPAFVPRLVAWVRRSGRLEVVLLLAILVAVAGIWTFASLAEEVVAGHTGQLDEHLLVALRQPGNLSVPIGPPWLLQVARDLTAFGGVVGIALVTGVVAGYLLLEGRRGLLAIVLVSVVGGTVLSLVVKHAFHRPRPNLVPYLTDIATASFPSGHSMLSSTAYLTMAALLARAVPGWRIKIYFLVVAVILSALIGCSRVYLGVHYPTDVLAGWGLGSAWAILCCGVAHFLAERRIVPDAEEKAA